MSKAFFADVDAKNATTRCNLALIGTFGNIWSFEAISKKLSFWFPTEAQFVFGAKGCLRQSAKTLSTHQQTESFLSAHRLHAQQCDPLRTSRWSDHLPSFLPPMFMRIVASQPDRLQLVA
jgi:hypothetical protein